MLINPHDGRQKHPATPSTNTFQQRHRISKTCSENQPKSPKLERHDSTEMSSSEFIVDEECILQLFKLCRECNKQCSVRKRVQGLKIVVHQTCCFCQSRFTWTNLPDADEDDGRKWKVISRSMDRPTQQRHQAATRAEMVCDSMFFESPSSSSNEDKRDTCAAPSLCSSENGKAPGKKDAAPQRAGGQDKQLTIKQSQNKVNRADVQEGEEEEFSTTLSVGDGRYLVDLGSSSEFIVDEECILQLFKLCRECNKQCSVRKRVQGLKIVVHQTCCFCQSRFTWTNLPDADEDDGLQVEGDFQINRQTNTAASPGSNTS
ncbi:hypothetical protein INR49_015436 [Caranx melampygus]|nr:hypothetical protein INR49_015436 [Caranx melampygus]